MTYQYRRVVTGHDVNGKAIVVRDDVVCAKELRPGAEASAIWATKGFPIDNDDPSDGAERVLGTSETAGTVFQIVHYLPGVTPRSQWTDSIDYAVVLAGEIDVKLDDEEVHLETEDVIIQRGRSTIGST